MEPPWKAVRLLRLPQRAGWHQKSVGVNQPSAVQVVFPEPVGVYPRLQLAAHDSPEIVALHAEASTPRPRGRPLLHGFPVHVGSAPEKLPAMHFHLAFSPLNPPPHMTEHLLPCFSPLQVCLYMSLFSDAGTSQVCTLQAGASPTKSPVSVQATEVELPLKPTSQVALQLIPLDKPLQLLVSTPLPLGKESRLHVIRLHLGALPLKVPSAWHLKSFVFFLYPGLQDTSQLSSLCVLAQALMSNTPSVFNASRLELLHSCFWQRGGVPTKLPVEPQMNSEELPRYSPVQETVHVSPVDKPTQPLVVIPGKVVGKPMPPEQGTFMLLGHRPKRPETLETTARISVAQAEHRPQCMSFARQPLQPCTASMHRATRAGPRWARPVRCCCSETA
mmetsp:Transcript_91248/g.164766  ORF Transcript_91248/g.164766 Transcript_91248/m.164766 type:complete len:389 (-) Transcript_91248:1589-2755(-)